MGQQRAGSGGTRANQNVGIQSTEPSVDAHREVRLALVMYGGVSLAIYMNGVSQELYHLVRATSPKSLTDDGEGSALPLVPDSKLTGTEVVYRKLGQALERLIDHPASVILATPSTDPITTRFVIDVLSGTSAGGINAIFLAKALANNQEINELQDLWLEQGDISKLLNDRRSHLPGLTPERPPESLLNNERMYFTLLEAFDAMERSRPNDGRADSPHVRELDLFVTTTDLRGVTLPLQLSNGVAFERRYRNVWHFVYGTAAASGEDRNDFEGRNDPMLAFAARCTSAFPFAFRPMLFEDMADPLSLFDDYRGIQLEEHPWSNFYRDYFPTPGTKPPKALDPEHQLPFLKRPFADGGALDNKPFTWATDQLVRRRADVPVDRKLIYIEPDPGHPELERTKQNRPDALENFELQGMSLPRQEAVRQDLQSILDRNRTIERVDRILHGLMPQVFGIPRAEAELGDAWADQNTEAGIEAYGSCYGGYHRLKVATVTDDLCDLIASVAGFDDDSDEFLAIRYLVRSWRDDHYTYNRDHSPEVPFTFNRFLLDFDLQHRLRRLVFLRKRVDGLYALDGAAIDLLETSARMDITSNEAITPLTADFVKDDVRQAFGDDLRRAKKELSRIYVRLRLLGRQLRTPRSSPLTLDLGSIALSRESLKEVLEPTWEQGRQAKAASLLADLGRRDSLQALADHLAFFLRNGISIPSDDPVSGEGTEGYGMESAADDLRGLLNGEGEVQLGRVVGPILRAYLDAFDDFDMVAFPMLYGTDAGEADPVEIIRISPEDAPSIIDERAAGFTTRKTRGWKYNHFGAFLDADWRKNDILFGRLDAAECLINTLVPTCSPDRTALLQQAQRAIILESLSPEQQLAILGPEPPLGLSDQQLVERFRKNYRVAEDLPPAVALPMAARGIEVGGKVMRQVSDDKGGTKAPVAFIARLGSLFAGVVELAIPGSSPFLIFRHLAALLVLFEATMIGLGWVFRSSDVRHIGIAGLVVTLALVLLVFLLSRTIQGGRWPWRLVKGAMWVLLAVAVAAAIAATAVTIKRDGTHPTMYWRELVSLFEHAKSSASSSR